MRLFNIAALAGSMVFMTACESGVHAGPTVNPGGILYSIEASTNEEGDCRPSREDVADIGDSGLFAVRGESVYLMPDGKTEIPFQSVFKNPDDEGIADDSAITMLNYGGACSELTIEITVEYCEYYGDSGIEKRACPEIVIVGAENFADIQLIRQDNAES